MQYLRYNCISPAADRGGRWRGSWAAKQQCGGRRRWVPTRDNHNAPPPPRTPLTPAAQIYSHLHILTLQRSGVPQDVGQHKNNVLSPVTCLSQYFSQNNARTTSY
ncbi:hypothetical protein ACJJTC_004554 [Scirpophaga incertulas]